MQQPPLGLTELVLAYARDAADRERRRDEVLNRIDATTQALSARRIGDLDAVTMSDAIVNEIVRGWQASKFLDPWNWLTTEGRKNVARCVEDFLTARRAK